MMDPDEAERLEARLTQMEAAILIDHAHVENLIERAYELETQVGAAVLAIKSLENRMAHVERATPLRRPGKRPTR